MFIELLERVLLRLGCADTDEKLESCVARFLTPVILKITSPHDNVRNKVNINIIYLYFINTLCLYIKGGRSVDTH